MRSVRSTSNGRAGRCAGLVAGLALVAVLTGCGSDDSGDSGSAAEPDPGSSSSSATESATTGEPSEGDAGDEVEVAGFVDRLQAGIEKTKYAHIQFTMSGAAGDMKGSGDLDYTAKPPNMQMTMELGAESLRMVLVDKVMYAQFSQAGKKYVKYDLSDPSNPLGSGMSEQLDPAASMQNFAQAVSSVTSAGNEDVDGRTLERYELVVDTTRLTDKAAAAQLPPEMEVTVWLDEEGRMAKSRMNMGAIVYEATLTDFDDRVEVQAPPADQVNEAPPPQ